MSQSLFGRLLAIGIAVVLSVIPPVAKATNFGSNITHPCDTSIYSECIANNGYHVVCFDSVQADQVTASRWAMTNNYNPVASVQTAEVACSSGTAAFDVKVRDANYGTGYWAWTQCTADATYGGTDPNRWCKPQYFKWELNTQGSWGTTFKRRYVACHELGHTLGLQHTTNSASCLYQSATSNALTQHDIDHLNSAYGTQAPLEPIP